MSAEMLQVANHWYWLGAFIGFVGGFILGALVCWQYFYRRIEP